MRLSTHNLLICNKNTCRNTDKNYPLKIVTEEIDIRKIDYDEEKTKIVYNKLDINGLNSALVDINMQSYDLSKITEEIKETKEFWEFMHHVLFEFNIIKGKLICPNCQREYEIIRGIPDMVLTDNEI
ncbi:MAG: hypothetical protein MJ252_14015 [archaeon]|nr:hypothetical protein [archaeon]